jgi:N-acetyl-gamma-glutamyl-phosphate reductase
MNETPSVASSLRVGIAGATGYSGQELLRLLARHPAARLVTAMSSGGGDPRPLPALAKIWDGKALPLDLDVLASQCDVVFLCLPEKAAADTGAHLVDRGARVIDLSGAFRLRDDGHRRRWYPETAALPEGTLYALPERSRTTLPQARLVSCPGCYPTAALIALQPLADAGLLDGDVVIDAKSGVSGAGRSLKQNILFCEAGEGMSPYAIASHRHAPEIEQEVSRAAGQAVIVNFTPHLVPMSRGELVTVYARLRRGSTADECAATLAARYRDEPFVFLSPKGIMPATQTVRGSNNVVLGVYADRMPGRVILVAALDNLVKGSAGQALQNFNLMFGLPETTGLEQVALFP